MGETATFRVPYKHHWRGEPRQWAEVVRAPGAGWIVRRRQGEDGEPLREDTYPSLLSVRRALRGSYDLKALPEPDHTRAELCQELTAAVVTWWAREGDYLVFPELAIGADDRPEHVPGDRRSGPPLVARRVDVLAVGVWSRTNYRRLAFEVKADRADWREELRRPEKRSLAMGLAHEFWFVTPKGVARPEEVPAGTGLLEYRPTSPSPFRRVVPAPLNGEAYLTDELAARLLMRAAPCAILRNRLYKSEE